MADEHELERFVAPSGPSEASEWLHGHAEVYGRTSGDLLAMGLAVRVSAVGYGRALRLAVTDNRGWSLGWTVGSSEELQALLRGLLAPGAQAYVERNLEKPKRHR
jgi:hypothetical protein